MDAVTNYHFKNVVEAWNCDLERAILVQLLFDAGGGWERAVSMWRCRNDAATEQAVKAVISDLEAEIAALIAEGENPALHNWKPATIVG